ASRLLIWRPRARRSQSHDLPDRCPSHWTGRRRVRQQLCARLVMLSPAPPRASRFSALAFQIQPFLPSVALSFFLPSLLFSAFLILASLPSVLLPSFLLSLYLFAFPL